MGQTLQRTAGEPERATLLEKRYEVLIRRAKRNAVGGLQGDK